MGGESIFAYELGDRLADELVGERFEALSRYLRSDEYLSEEWVSTLFGLRDKELETGNRLLNPDIYAFAAIESRKMRQIDFLEGVDIDELSNRTIGKLFYEVRTMYYAHSGIHSMLYRRDRLEAGAAIYDKYLGQNLHPESFAARQAGNMFEELAFYDMLTSQNTQNLEKAQKYNHYVVERTSSWHYAYRMHALMSLFDLESFAAISRSKSRGQNPYYELRDVHIGFNHALESLSDEIREYSKNCKYSIATADEPARTDEDTQITGHLHNMSGALAEGLAISVLQDYLLSSGMSKRFWVRQAFLREDSMGERRLANPQDESKITSLAVPNMSFDLQIYEHTNPDGIRIPVEVKKRENPEPDTLHPDIKVITFKDSRLPESFAKYVKRFATSMSAKHSSERRSGRQNRMAKEIVDRVDPARLFVSRS